MSLRDLEAKWIGSDDVVWSGRGCVQETSEFQNIGRQPGLEVSANNTMSVALRIQ